MLFFLVIIFNLYVYTCSKPTEIICNDAQINAKILYNCIENFKELSICSKKLNFTEKTLFQFNFDNCK